jgi:chemotaxis signal transduction protein
MHSDQSVCHIALTCPHCGKHYKKVPYEAIKKHQFAFCKQCNTKFRVEPSVLEEALKQAGAALAGPCLEISETVSKQREYDTSRAGEREAVSAQSGQIQDTQTMPGPQDLAQHAAAAAQGFLQEPFAPGEPHDGGLFSKLFAAQQIEAEEQSGIEGSFEQKINKLAASIDETFGEQQESSGALDAGDITVKNIFKDTFINTTQADNAPEADENYSERLSAPSMQELEGLHREEPIECQPGMIPAEETSSQEAFEAPLLQSQAMQAPVEVETSREPIEEPLLGEELSAASAESAFEEEPLEEGIEEQPIDVSAEVDASGETFEELLFDKQFSAAFTEPAFKEEPLEERIEEVQPIDVSVEVDISGETFEELLIDEQFREVYEEPSFEEDILENALIEDQLSDVSAGVDASGEIFEEPLSNEQFSEVFAEPAFGEEIFEDALIEDQSGEQFEQDKVYLIEAQKKGSGTAQLSELNLSHKGFPVSQGDTGGNRDVSDMLRNLVLPTAEIQEGMEQFVLFFLGEHLFAAPVVNVFELSLPPDFIMVPNTPQWLLGIANMRGEIISIVDLKGFLGMDQESIKRTSRMIIVQTKDRQLMVGLVVDSINGIKYFPTDEVSPLQQKAPGQAAAYLNGAFVHEDMTVAILDCEILLQSQKMQQFQ